MAQVRVGQIDMTTGEMLEGAALAVVYPKRRNGFGKGWVAVSQDPMLELAKADIGSEAWRVFAHLIGILDFENWINLNQTAAAELLGMKRPGYARGLRKLIDVGVVLPGPRVGRNATFRLNPHYGWKGSAKGHNEALHERMRARGLSVVSGGSPAAVAASEAAPEPAEGVDTLTFDMFEGDASGG